MVSKMEHKKEVIVLNSMKMMRWTCMLKRSHFFSCTEKKTIIIETFDSIKLEIQTYGCVCVSACRYAGTELCI